MELSFGLLLFSIVIAATIWFWREALRMRDVASHAAMAACEKLGLQFLDGTAAFGAWRWQREARRLRLRRVYVFDYTARSIERRQGFVVLLAGQVESIGFARDDDVNLKSPPQAPTVNVTMTYGPQPSQLEATAAEEPDRDSNNQGNPVGAKVLDLAEWRRNRRPGERLH